MAKRSKGRIRGSLLAGVAGSNPAGDMDVCVVESGQKAKCRIIKTQKRIRLKYRERTRE